MSGFVHFVDSDESILGVIYKYKPLRVWTHHLSLVQLAVRQHLSLAEPRKENQKQETKLTKKS